MYESMCMIMFNGEEVQQSSLSYVFRFAFLALTVYKTQDVHGRGPCKVNLGIFV